MAPLSVHSSAGGTHQHGAGLEGEPVQNLADRLVGGDAAGGDQRVRLAVMLAEHLHAGAQPVADDFDHALLERGAEIAHVLFAQRRDPFRLEPQRGLEPRERKVGVRRAQHGPRQREARGIARQRLALDLRAAGIAEPQELRRLVEGLADGVVDGGAEPHIIADAQHRDDLRVSAGGEKQAIGKRRARR